MNYNHLLYFHTLAHHEHYHRAAQQLHITQPSLSKAIHNLESDLGVKLFEQKGRGVRLTKEGRRYLTYVEHALEELQTGYEMLQYEQIKEDNFLRLGLVMSTVYSHFPSWITGFRSQTDKKVFYSCTNDTSDALAQELLYGTMDLIICSKVAMKGIEYVPLFTQQLILLAPSSHRLAGRNEVDIQELNGEDFIAHSRRTAMHDILADIYRKNHIRVQIVSEADEDRAVLGMVRAGLGCGVTTQSPEIFGTDFSAIPITGSGFDGQICVGKREQAKLPKIAEAFFQYLIHNK